MWANPCVAEFDEVTLVKGEPVPIGAVAVVTMTCGPGRVIGSVMERRERLEMLAFIYSFTCLARPAKVLYQARVQW